MLTKSTVFLRFFMLVLVVCSGFARAQKQAPEFITSIFNGGQPYMVIAASGSGKGPLRFEPGIYAREGKDWHLIRGGQVLMDYHKGPWVQQLALSKVSPQYYALTVVDGQLVLFNVHSRADRPDTLLRFGDNLPVRELDTGRAVSLIPPIEDVRQIEVYAVEDKYIDGTQVVLISLRSQTPGFQEMTLALVLKADSSGRLVVHRGPYALDYKFRKSEELAKLVRVVPGEQDYEVYSDLLKDSPLQRLKKSSEAHRQLIRDTLETYVNTSFPEDVNKAAIVYRLLEDNMIVKTPPFIRQVGRSTPFSITQTYDIESALGWVSVANGNEKTKIENVGFFDLKPGAPSLRPFFMEESQKGLVVVSIDKKILLYVASDRGTLGPLNLGSLQELFEIQNEETEVKLTNLSLTYVTNVGRSVKIIVSCEAEVQVPGGKISTTGRTFLYDVGPLNSGQWIVNRRFSLVSQFYTSGAISKRIAVKEQSSLFALSNPTVTEEAKIPSAIDVHDAYVDISASTDELKYDYLTPIRSVAISEALKYNEYRPHSKVPVRTGLSFVKASPFQADPTSFVEGSLRPMKGEEDKEIYLLNPQQNQFHFGLASTPGPTTISVIPMENTQGNPILAIAVEVRSAPSGAFQKLTSVRLNRSFKTLENVYVVQGRDSASNMFYVIQQHSEAGGTGPSLQVNGFRMANQADNRPLLEVTTEYVFHGGALRDAIVSERLVFDRTGKLYWIDTPELDPKNRKWTVVSLDGKNSFMPNADFSGRGPEFDPVTMHFKSQEGVRRTETSFRSPWTLTRELVARDLKRQSESLNRAENLLFEDLDKAVSNLARSRQGGERLVILLPSEIRDQYHNHLLRVYADEEGSRDFNFRNESLYVYRFNGKQAPHQEDILTNMDLMAKRSGEGLSSLILSKISDLNEAARPKHSRGLERAFQISLVNIGEEYGVGQGNLTGRKLLPHALYLMDVGETEELNQLRDPSVHSSSKLLLVGTDGEWEALKTSMPDEERQGFFENYKVIDFRALTPQSMATMMAQFLDQPEIVRLGYSYALDKRGNTANLATQTQIRNYLLELAATRIQSFAAERGRDSVRPFMRYYAKFTQAIVGDVYNNTVDRAFFERILSEVFNLTVNNEILPPNDPQVLASNDDYVIRLSREGFRGSYDTKYGLQSDILASQQADNTIAIPGSRIIIGPPGNGKSTFVRAEIRALGLREYRIAAGAEDENNRMADAFVLSVGDLANSPRNGFRNDNDRPNPGVLTVDVALQHLEHWLTLPKAQRGFLYLDDFDKGTDEIKTRLNQFLRKLTDARNGVDIVSPFTGATVEGFSPRGLKLRVIMNPPEDYQNNMSKFQMAIDAMSSKEYKVDESHLGRFREVDFWDRSASSGKIAQLRVDFMNQAKRTARDRQLGLLLSSSLIEALRKQFGTDMDARPFIGGAINGLDVLAVQQAREDVVYMFDILSREDSKSQPTPSTEVGRSNIQKFISQNAVLRPVSLNNWEGLVKFVQQNIEAFRVNIYESLIASVRDNDRMAGDQRKQRDLLRPILMAIRDHLNHFSRMSLADLRLNPSDFKITRSSDRRAFMDLIQAESLTVPSLNFEFSQDEEIMNQVRALRGQRPESNQRTRSHVLRGVQDHLTTVLEKALSTALNVTDVRRPPSPTAWLADLDKVKPYVEGTGSEIANQLISVLPLLVQNDLREMSDPTTQYAPAVYDLARLFLVALERAMGDLQWSQASQILLSGLQEATVNPIAIQAIAVQDYFFSSPVSLLRPVSMDDLTEYIDNIPLISQVPAGERVAISARYDQACNVLLSSSQEGAR